jgi:hypothetical protein
MLKTPIVGRERPAAIARYQRKCTHPANERQQHHGSELVIPLESGGASRVDIGVPVVLYTPSRVVRQTNLIALIALISSSVTTSQDAGRKPRTTCKPHRSRVACTTSQDYQRSVPLKKNCSTKHTQVRCTVQYTVCGSSQPVALWLAAYACCRPSEHTKKPPEHDGSRGLGGGCYANDAASLMILTPCL